MRLRFTADFDNLQEMLNFTDMIRNDSAETNTDHDALFERIKTMANTQIADLIAKMQGSFATLNAEQARGAAAIDRLLAMVADMPRRIQEAVDAAVANGVDEDQLSALTALASDVEGEVAEAQAEADKLETVAPAPVPVPPAPPVDEVPPVAGEVPPVVDEVPPADGGVVPPVSGDVPPGDAGSDTTGGGAPVPTPGA